MIGCFFIVGMQTDAKKLTCASLGLYIKAVVPSAGAGESRYKNKAIKRWKHMCIFGTNHKLVLSRPFPLFFHDYILLYFVIFVNILLCSYWIASWHLCLQARFSPSHSSYQLDWWLHRQNNPKLAQATSSQTSLSFLSRDSRYFVKLLPIDNTAAD